MGYELEGMQWDVDDFKQYINEVKDSMSWANSITMHHTASPDLSMRPDGLTLKHMQYLREYYENELGWSAGPHLFIDDKHISGMSGLQRRGVHAVSFNKDSIGIEVLGYYDYGCDDPFSGRGALAWERATATASILLEAMGLDINEDTIHFHRDDPKTSKTCPGQSIDKKWFVQKVRKYRDGDSSDVDPTPTTDYPDIPQYTGKYVISNGKWYAPLMEFSKEFYGEPANLSYGEFFIGDRVLEDTYYDSDEETTFANISDILNIK